MSETFQPFTPSTSPSPEISAPRTPEQKGQQACLAAQEIYRRNPDWVSFFREVMGVDGIIRKMFPNPQEMAIFEKSPEYLEIQQMLGRLRDRAKHPNEKDEPTRVITVRLPKSLHESLRHEAYERKTSMNQLCISKLLQIIDKSG
jgi:predicted HicB family RNase H-like nuclease